MLNSLRNLFFKEKAAPEAGDGQVTLADVLDRGWFELFYQPKIELKTMRLVGAEGLVRARHPTRGCPLPQEQMIFGPKTDIDSRRTGWPRHGREPLRIDIDGAVKRDFNQPFQQG